MTPKKLILSNQGKELSGLPKINLRLKLEIDKNKKHRAARKSGNGGRNKYNFQLSKIRRILQ